jgi:hypothetical protein
LGEHLDAFSLFAVKYFSKFQDAQKSTIANEKMGRETSPLQLHRSHKRLTAKLKAHFSRQLACRK